MPFDCYVRRAIEDDKVIFPKKFAKTDEDAEKHNKGKSPNFHVKSLEAERTSMRSIFRYMCQYHNDPIDESTIEFKRSYIQRVKFTSDIMKQLDQEMAIISIDPAVRLKETNDRTGIVVTKPLPLLKQRVIMEAIGKRIPVDKVVQEIFRLVSIYKTERVLVETVAAQLWLVKILKDEMIKRGVYFTIDEVKPSTKETKVARIRGLLPYYANGRILHRDGLDDLEAELIQFPRARHDDIVDSLAMQILYWKELMPSGKFEKPKSKVPFSLDWFKSRLPKLHTAEEKIFKGLARRKPQI